MRGGNCRLEPFEMLTLLISVMIVYASISVALLISYFLTTRDDQELDL